MNFRLFPLALATLLMTSGLAIADNADVACKLKGNWLGYWKLNDKSGRLSTHITQCSNSQLSGYSLWYGMAEKETRMSFDKAEIKNGQLHIYYEQALSLEGQLSADGKSIKGHWNSAAGGGTVELKKKGR